MPIILLLLLLLLIIFGPQLWTRRVLAQYNQPRQDFPGNGAAFAQHLLAQHNLSHIPVEITEEGDHYDPLTRTVRLSPEYWHGRSLTAIVVAAHEVGHALQDQSNYQPFHARIKLVTTAQKAEKIGAGLMMAIPVIALIMRLPAAGILLFLAGFSSLATSVIVHFITLPVEWDASFNRALPILAQNRYLSQRDQRAARKILTACALTYVASSLTSLLNLWRWLAILRR
ncbi:MAG: zinc metallopeptidase [Pseudomonadota bacterium]|nr:zinc metallopeptidase [Pseudomonadota bacterium]